MKRTCFKKILIISIVSILLLAGILFLIVYHQMHRTIHLSFDIFQSNEEFQYKDIEWGASVEEVNEKFPFSFKQNTARIPAPENYLFYDITNLFVLDGMKGTSVCEFYNGEFQLIEFYFYFDKDSEEYMPWFEKQVADLKALYGPEDKRGGVKSEESDWNSDVYVWKTNNTQLQFSIMYGENTRTMVFFAVGRIVQQ